MTFLILLLLNIWAGWISSLIQPTFVDDMNKRMLPDYSDPRRKQKHRNQTIIQYLRVVLGGDCT